MNKQIGIKMSLAVIIITLLIVSTLFASRAISQFAGNTQANTPTELAGTAGINGACWRCLL